MRVAGMGAPHRRPENKDRQKKENARNLQPQNAAHPSKRPQKAAHAAYHPSTGPHRRAPSAFARGCSGLCSARRRLATAAHPLAGHASRHSNSRAQHPPNGLRFHVRYDVSSGGRDPALHRFLGSPRLRLALDGSKVDRTCAATRAIHALAAALEVLRDIPPARTHPATRRSHP